MAHDLTQFGIVASALSGNVRSAADASRTDRFRGLLVDAYAPGLSLPELSQSGRRELRHVLSSRDQQLVGLQVALGAKGLGPGADVDQQLTRLERAMDAARGLAVPVVCVDLGNLPPAPVAAKPKPRITPEQAGLIILPTAPVVEESSPPPPVKVDPAFQSQVDAALVELGRRADRYSVILAMRSDLSSFASLRQAIAQADCPWFGLDLDPVAVLRDEWSLDEVLSSFAGLVRHVRARDAVAGADRRTTPAIVGQGSTDWPELLSALDSSDYHGWITLDPLELPDRRRAAVAGRDHLTRLRQ